MPIVQDDSLMLIGKEMLSPFSSELIVNEPIEYLSGVHSYRVFLVKTSP